MTTFVIPIAAWWMKFIFTPVLGSVAVVCVIWGVRKFIWCIQIICGICPPPPKATRAGAFIGLAIHLIIIAIGLSAGYFLLGLLTTQPYVISDEGITVGARPPHYQPRFISWQQISHVDCRLTHGSRKISGLIIYSTQGHEVLGNGSVALEPVWTFLQERLPSQAFTPCEFEED